LLTDKINKKRIRKLYFTRSALLNKINLKVV